MINLKIGLGFVFILNTTKKEWHTFQEPLQECLKNNVLHCLPKGEMKILEEAQYHKDDFECWYEIHGRLKDNQLEVAIIQVERPQNEE